MKEIMENIGASVLVLGPNLEIRNINLHTRAPFDAAYAVAPAPPFVAIRLLTLMIQPE